MIYLPTYLRILEESSLFVVEFLLLALPLLPQCPFSVCFGHQESFGGFTLVSGDPLLLVTI